MQLYSKEKQVSQPIEGHATAFATLLLENATSATRLFTFAVRNQSGAKVIICNCIVTIFNKFLIIIN